jgi:excisionase family DNA binding protein
MHVDNRSMKAEGGEVDGGVLKPHVHLAVEALRALGRAVASTAVTPPGQTASDRISSSDVSLAAMRVLADVLAEQISHAMRRAPGASDQHAPSAAPDDSVTPEEFAERLERHLTARHSAPAIALTPAERIRRFIESHYAEDLTLEAIAGAAGCARSLVAATVKHHLGMTTHRYIVRMRIRRAAELIAQGDKIEAVMLSVGYRSKKNFYRQFKIETGLTPAVYRRLRSAEESTAIAEGPEEPGAYRLDAPNLPAMSACAIIGCEHPVPSVTISGASELLGVSRRTVYYWIKNGKLQTIRRLVGGQRILVDSFSVVKTR